MGTIYSMKTKPSLRTMVCTVENSELAAKIKHELLKVSFYQTSTNNSKPHFFKTTARYLHCWHLEAKFAVWQQMYHGYSCTYIHFISPTVVSLMAIKNCSKSAVGKWLIQARNPTLGVASPKSYHMAWILSYTLSFVLCLYSHRSLTHPKQPVGWKVNEKSKRQSYQTL